MSYTVENLEKSMAKITITVDADAFEEAMVKSYNKNKKNISIQGFRKGKAPRKMVEKLYGPEVFYEDAANFAIPDAYEEAAKESGLEIVSRPEIDVVEIENRLVFGIQLYRLLALRGNETHIVVNLRIGFRIVHEDVFKRRAEHVSDNANGTAVFLVKECRRL